MHIPEAISHPLKYQKFVDEEIQLLEKPKYSFYHNKWKMALEYSASQNMILTRCILFPNVTSIIRIELLLHVP